MAAEPCGDDVAGAAVDTAADASVTAASGTGGASGASDSSSIHYITDVRQADVLGGSGQYWHKGNGQYRKTLALFAAKENFSALTTSRKSEIIEKVIASVADKGGRFLRPVSSSEAVELGVPKGISAWVELDRTAIGLKITAALLELCRHVPVAAVSVDAMGPSKADVARTQTAQRTTAQAENRMVLAARVGRCDIFQVLVTATQSSVWYGIRIHTFPQLPLYMRAAFPAHTTTCAYIHDVAKGSPAELAGLAQFDVVCWLGNVPGTGVWTDLPCLAAMRLPTAFDFICTADMGTSQSGVVFCLYVARFNSKQARDNSTLNAECIDQPNLLLTQQFASSISVGWQHPMAKHADSSDASSNNGHYGIGEGPLQGSNVPQVLNESKDSDTVGGLESPLFSTTQAHKDTVAEPLPGTTDDVDRAATCRKIAYALRIRMATAVSGDATIPSKDDVTGLSKADAAGLSKVDETGPWNADTTSGTIRYIAEYRPNDVLTGMGKGLAFSVHLGNVKFRKLVSDRELEYNSAVSREVKRDIIKSIADRVFISNGRFLRQVDSAVEEKERSGPDGVAAWVLMEKAAVAKKIQGALLTMKTRDNRNSTAFTKLHVIDVVTGSSNVPFDFGVAAGISDGQAAAGRPMQDWKSLL